MFMLQMFRIFYGMTGFWFDRSAQFLFTYGKSAIDFIAGKVSVVFHVIVPFLGRAIPSIILMGQGRLAAQEQDLNVAILGLGGRAQDVLCECLKLKQEGKKGIQVVAVCDDHAQDSLSFFLKNRLSPQMAADYQKMFRDVQIYPDREEGLRALFSDHPNLDRIFITSPNYRHFAHTKAASVYSSCKNWYLEKPLFCTMQEFNDFNLNLDQRTIHVGLTLRYALITKLVVDKLREYGPQLGQLRKVHSWEHVNFGHGLSIIMMNWRRYASLSGGLLLDKSVHDLDLAFYYMAAVGVLPTSISVSTQASHQFYKKSNREMIANCLLRDKALRENAERWDNVPWQRIVPFAYDKNGKIDWLQTMDLFFREFPEDEQLEFSDIIPDTHQLNAKITDSSSHEIDYTLDLKLNGFATTTHRGCKLSFNKGEAEVDLEASTLRIQRNDHPPVVFDLNTRNIPHAGGDVYVAHTVLGALPEGNHQAEFADPSLQISTILSLVSEEQARTCDPTPRKISKVNNQWVVE